MPSISFLVDVQSGYDYVYEMGRWALFGGTGGGLPSVGSCSSQPDTKEDYFRKKVRFGLTVINLNSKPNQKAFFFLAHSSQQ